jgi:GT2 family glycosyltransferase
MTLPAPVSVPIAVVIPTFNRGDAVLLTLKRVFACRPTPAEVWVHIDGGDDRLAASLARQYPAVRVLASPARLGPGGGRDRCLKACSTPYAVSFDDDSYPFDPDFFAVAFELLNENPQAAIINASIWHRHQPVKPREARLTRCVSYTGCGHAIRLSAYRDIRGYLPRPVAYGMEESDIALQLFAAGWTMLESGQLRVFHDTELRHHDSAEIVAGTAANVALFVFLNYPVLLWSWGLVQLGNFVGYCLRAGRSGGLLSGLSRIPADCYRHRAYRQPVALSTVVKFLRLRRSEP